MALPTASVDSTIQNGLKVIQGYSVNQTDLLAGNAQEYASHATGYIAELVGVTQAATGNAAGTLTFVNNTTGQTIGVLNVPANTAKGTVITQSTLINVNAAFGGDGGMGGVPGPTVTGFKAPPLPTVPDVISVTSAGFTTSGAINGFFVIIAP